MEAHVQIHRLRECHLCGKRFQRKQNADIHLLGVHNLTKDDLAKLGRWNPKKDPDHCPEYMTRKANSSFKKFRQKQAKSKREAEAEAATTETAAKAVAAGSNVAVAPDGERLIIIVRGKEEDIRDDIAEEEESEEEEEEIEGPHELIVVPKVGRGRGQVTVEEFMAAADRLKN